MCHTIRVPKFETSLHEKKNICVDQKYLQPESMRALNGVGLLALWPLHPKFVEKGLMSKDLGFIRAPRKVARYWRFRKHYKGKSVEKDNTRGSHRPHTRP